ncbi:hypothetical protein MRX96_030929 [Rhipicephalus microplus]
MMSERAPRSSTFQIKIWLSAVCARTSLSRGKHERKRGVRNNRVPWDIGRTVEASEGGLWNRGLSSAPRAEAPIHGSVSLVQPSELALSPRTGSPRSRQLGAQRGAGRPFAGTALRGRSSRGFGARPSRINRSSQSGLCFSCGQRPRGQRADRLAELTSDPSSLFFSDCPR